MPFKHEQNLFMASISHELRTPLTSILGYGELLNQTKLDKKQQEYLTRMLQSSTYLLSLVGDFLDIVKLEAHEIKLEKKELSLHHLLTECADVIRANLHKDTKFKLDIPFLDYTVFSDARRIKQVMLNILSNAVKFTKNGTINFYVKEIVDLADNIKITVNIEDSGKGMSQEVQKTLFAPFVTADSTQGFGLGLFISKKIIELMNGNITVISQEGKGSTFSISFIVKKGKKKELSSALVGKNILIFSNHRKFTKKLSSLIQNFNARLECFSLEEDISDILNNIVTHIREYDIVIFDINNIPSETVDIISTLRLIHPALQCIALIDRTSYTGSENFDSFIDIPIKAKNLIYEIEERLAKRPLKHKGSVDFSHINVLIVEDVEMSREYIKEMLMVSFGIRCDTAVNGKEAVRKAKNKKYDIIFMDIRMPVMNGHEATIEIRKFNKDIFIVCMSADVYEKDRVAAKESGMDAFIEKPLNKNELHQCLLHFMNGGIKNIDMKIDNKNSAEMNSGLTLKSKAYKHLAEMFEGDVLENLWGAAVQSLQNSFRNINLHTKEKNMDALEEDFHAIKGILANLSLKEEAVKAGQIQELFHEGKWKKGSNAKHKLMQSITCFIEKSKSNSK